MGQGCTLHVLTSTDGPCKEQFLPPCRGAGFVQFLMLYLVPLPQDRVHDVKFAHTV